MAVLFSTSLYLLSILVHSLSHCYSIEAEALSTGWNFDHGTLINNSGIKTGVSTFSEVCNQFNHARGHKIICILCKGFDPSCFIPPTSTTSTTTVPTTTTISTSTTPASTTTTTPPTPPEE